MSMECSECERDLRGGHAKDCSRYTDEGGATFGTVYDDADARFISTANPAVISEFLDRLQAVETERDNANAAAAGIALQAEKLEAERDALRAKIEQMKQQEPVAFALYSGWARKAVFLTEIEACEQRDRRQLTADLSGSLEAYRVIPLYALHGAKGE